MKLIGHQLGRIILLFPPEQIRPTRGIPIKDTIAAVQNRYNFVNVPDLTKPIAEFERNGYQFINGKIILDAKEYVINEFTVYNDGVSISSVDTEYSDWFLEDFVRWAQDKLEYRPFLQEPTKIFRSQVTVSFDKPLSNIIKNFDAFSQALSLAIENVIEKPVSTNLLRIDFGIDDTGVGGIKPVPFSLERRIGVPSNKEWFISEAPLPSKTHLELLEELEAAIG